MCQEAVRRLCNPSASCHVRKVARLLARPLRVDVINTLEGGASGDHLVAYGQRLRYAGCFTHALQPEIRREVWWCGRVLGDSTQKPFGRSNAWSDLPHVTVVRVIVDLFGHLFSRLFLGKSSLPAAITNSTRAHRQSVASCEA
jgi:hypothetical protein